MIKLTLTGYQWGANMRFVGPYEFPSNMDQHAIHMPPNTTLIAPPDAAPGQFAEWDADAGQWALRDEPVPVPAAPIIPAEHLLDQQARAEVTDGH